MKKREASVALCAGRYVNCAVPEQTGRSSSITYDRCSIWGRSSLAALSIKCHAQVCFALTGAQQVEQVFSTVSVIALLEFHESIRLVHGNPHHIGIQDAAIRDPVEQAEEV
jgi:hypothetical protein